jgi:hypothetical protein
MAWNILSSILAGCAYHYGIKKIFPSSVEIFHAPLGQLLASQRLTHLGNEIVHKQRLFLLSTMT